jgi:hypothetical protein
LPILPVHYVLDEDWALLSEKNRGKWEPRDVSEVTQAYERSGKVFIMIPINTRKLSIVVPGSDGTSHTGIIHESYTPLTIEW